MLSFQTTISGSPNILMVKRTEGNTPFVSESHEIFILKSVNVFLLNCKLSPVLLRAVVVVPLHQPRVTQYGKASLKKVT